MVQLQHRRSSGFAKRGAGRGERRLAPVPLEEPHTDLLLKGSYLKAQSRLAEMNQFRRPAEVQCLRDGQKGSNLTKFHWSIVFDLLITGYKTTNFPNVCAVRVIGPSAKERLDATPTLGT